MPGTAHVSPTMEDYLEAIFELRRDRGVARVRDISKALGVAASTVSNALRALSDQGLVHYQPYEMVTLSTKGDEVARRVERRHQLIRRFIAEILGVEDSVASRDACRLEHGISPEAFRRLALFMEFVDTCPRAGEGLVERFQSFCVQRGVGPDECRECIQRSVEEVENRVKETGVVAAGLIPLSSLSPGRRGVIRKILARGTLGRRMVDMGVTAGSPVLVIKMAPLGDPMEVEVKGYHLSLRKEEAEQVLVEPEVGGR